eukprot:Rmarinus@m.22736
MLRFAALSRAAGRSISSTASANYKVGVLGAAGGIGQPTALLLKEVEQISHLSLYDVAPVTPGVAADISHICTPGKVSGYGKDDVGKALDGCDIVVIPAGVPRKPGMTRDDLFNTNASIVQTLAEACSKHCPKAKLLIISNPVNSTVPIVAETLKKAGTYDPRRLFGVTTLDVVRANCFVAEAMGKTKLRDDVIVIGGHAGTTILPLLSQVKGAKFSDEEIKALTHRIQFGGDEVVKAKAGQGSATLSMAYAAVKFTKSVLAAMDGSHVTECSYVQSDITEAEFFSSPVSLGKDGWESVHGFGPISASEQAGLDSMMPDLLAQIKKGKEFVK